MADDKSFATLTPINVAAKVAFHEVAEACLVQGEHLNYHARFMTISDHRLYDQEVAMTMERGLKEAGDSDTPTEADTDTENFRREAYPIWIGHYKFDLATGKPGSSNGWVAGKGRDREPEGVQLLLVAGLGRKSTIRGRHARFALSHQSGYLYVVRGSSAIMDLSVNGESLGQGPYVLNKSSVRLRLGSLEYLYQYTDYARTKDYAESRTAFLRSITDTDRPELWHFTPTPAINTRSIGDWTLATELGKGTYGRVYAATNIKGELVALKIIERNKRSANAVKEEIATLRALSEEAQNSKCERIALLRDVIFPHGKEDYPESLVFEEVSLIFTPVITETLAQRIYDYGPSKENLRLFKESLLAVQFLHLRGWMHRDLKPANVGVHGDLVVLLDLGNAIRPSIGFVDHMPGQLGTIGYLAPEMEMQPYGSAIDIWSMGVIGYELVYGRQPWSTRRNPWREGNENLRPGFSARYNMVCSQLLAADSDSIEDLLAQMLRHPWSGNSNPGARISVHDALDHPVWRSIDEPKEVENKRRRLLKD
ncbi:MAG: hypothetical protein L6R39_005332 [Caloplaca ligustica]|nr:MAG: hypothetical protein L6R39_005332 [Caloplaca ligustica]